MVLVDLASFCGKTAQNRCWHSFQETRHGRQPSRSPPLLVLLFLFSFFFPLASFLLSVLDLVSSQFSRLVGWTGRICPTAQAGGATALGSISLGCTPDSSCHRSPPWPAT